MLSSNWYITMTRTENQSVRLPGIQAAPGLQRIKQTFLGNNQHHYRKIPHRTEDRACQRTADVRGAIPERNSRYTDLFECLLPQRPIQACNRNDSQSLQEDKREQTQAA